MFHFFLQRHVIGHLRMASFNPKPLLFLKTNDQPRLDFTHKKIKERQNRRERLKRQEGQETLDRKEFFTRKLSHCMRWIEVWKTTFLIWLVWIAAPLKDLATRRLWTIAGSTKLWDLVHPPSTPAPTMQIIIIIYNHEDDGREHNDDPPSTPAPTVQIIIMIYNHEDDGREHNDDPPSTLHLLCR